MSAFTSRRVRLSREQETELAQCIQDGDQAARNELVEAHLGFVAWAAARYRGYGPSQDELISAGAIGLITAAERFEGNRSARFISYAKWYIRGAMLQELAEHPNTVRVPPSQLNAARRVAKAAGDYAQRHGRAPNADALASALGMSEKAVREALLFGRPTRSLDAPFSGREEGDTRTLLDVLPDESVPDSDESVEAASARSRLTQSLAVLNDEERAVLLLYFGLADGNPLTLEQIALEIGERLWRVRRIRDEALDKLIAASGDQEALEALFGMCGRSLSAAKLAQLRQRRADVSSVRRRRRESILNAVSDSYRRRHGRPLLPGELSRLADGWVS